MLSPGKLWRLLRRDLQRGWEATYHDYKTLPRIREWSPPAASETPETIPVHMLIGRHDWRRAAWTLASWTELSERIWPISVHDDGTLPQEAKTLLHKLFPTARFIGRKAADEKMNRLLQAFPFCHEFRTKHLHALKIFDVPEFTTGDRFLIFDSDVLFFNHPREILELINLDAGGCWFAEDVREGSLITAAEAREELGVKIWPRVNSGICLLKKGAIDLDLCDRALAQTSIPKGSGWRIEQTLLMLCAAKFGKGGLLPRSYEISLGKNAAEDAVCRRYTGGVRARFYSEGVNRLRDQLLPLEE